MLLLNDSLCWKHSARTVGKRYASDNSSSTGAYRFATYQVSVASAICVSGGYWVGSLASARARLQELAVTDLIPQFFWFLTNTNLCLVWSQNRVLQPPSAFNKYTAKM